MIYGNNLHSRSGTHQGEGVSASAILPPGADTGFYVGGGGGGGGGGGRDVVYMWFLQPQPFIILILHFGIKC